MFIIHSGRTQPPSFTPAKTHQLSLLPLSPHIPFSQFSVLLHNSPGLTTDFLVDTAVKLTTVAVINPSVATITKDNDFLFQ